VLKKTKQKNLAPNHTCRKSRRKIKIEAADVQGTGPIIKSRKQVLWVSNMAWQKNCQFI